MSSLSTSDLWHQRIASAKPEDYNQLLYDAVITAEPEHILKLLGLGAMLKSVDDKGNTALHVAAENGLHKNVQAITSFIADIEIENEKERTPLWFAAVKGHMECLTILLNHPKKPDHHLGETLDRVVELKLPKVADALLTYLLAQRGMEKCEKYGVLIEGGVVNQDVEMIKVFMKHGFSLNGGVTRRDGAGRARYRNEPDLTDLFYESNPIITAVRKDNLPMVEWLVEKGAIVDIRLFGDELHRYNVVNLLDFAEKRASPEIVEFLKSEMPAKPLEVD